MMLHLIHKFNYDGSANDRRFNISIIILEIGILVLEINILFLTSHILKAPHFTPVISIGTLYIL